MIMDMVSTTSGNHSTVNSNGSTVNSSGSTVNCSYITPTLNLYTDGSALSNRQNSPGGAACFIYNCNFLTSTSLYGTNNICELTAIRYSLNLILKNFHIFRPMFTTNTINLYTDSQYCIGVLTGTYKAKANIELINKIKQLQSQLNDLNITITFIHVRAHTNSTDIHSLCNRLVDHHANLSATELKTSGIVKRWSRKVLKKEFIDMLERCRVRC
jgi:ribonuclease HI